VRQLLVGTAPAAARALFLSAGVYDPVTANRLAGFGERMIGVHDIFSPRSVVRALRARAVA
jgi:hypothetical protein